MYISITDPCISYVNNVNQKSKRKIIFLKEGGGGGGRVKLDKLGGAHVLKG